MFLKFFKTKSRKYRKSARPKLEKLDNQNLQCVWNELAHSYFPELLHLNEFCIEWSNRSQKRVLASCNISSKMVRVAREFSKPAYVQWLEPLLFHEMCHAVLGENVEKHGRRRAWHGPSFKQLEARHPGIPALRAWIKVGGFSKAVELSRSSC